MQKRMFVAVKENGVWRIRKKSRVNESVLRSRYYVRNQERKTKMSKTCGTNVRRKNCEVDVEEYPGRKKDLLES